MMKELLRLLNEENITYSELAAKLKITQAELKNRIELAKHLGYLESIPSDACEDQVCCDTCPKGRNTCSFSPRLRVDNTTYQLTKKGRKVIGYTKKRETIMKNMGKDNNK
jgi:hypothetical protein